MYEVQYACVPSIYLKPTSQSQMTLARLFLDGLLHLETQIQMCVHKVITTGNIVAFCLNRKEKLVQTASCWASTP